MKLLCGDALEILRTLEPDSVHTCITSPPYYGLRSYGCSGEIGKEPTLTEYVERLVSVFREVHRVLRKDGTLWLVLGDSYAGSGKAGKNPAYQVRHTEFGRPSVHPERFGLSGFVPNGLKPKDLCGVPWRVAFALQADGWYLRSDCIWHKPNCMPSSVTDRPTSAHEYVFLLSKSARYYYDRYAIIEPYTSVSMGAASTFRRPHSKRAVAFPGQTVGTHRPNRVDAVYGHGGRNRRSVWAIPTRPFRGAHFAVFPPDLVEVCLLAGTSEHGACPRCSAPWRRQVVSSHPKAESLRDGTWESTAEDMGITGTDGRGGRLQVGLDTKSAAEKSPTYQTVGWAPSCACAGRDVVSPTVLDPFMGSGTVGVVCAKHHRDFVGVDLNPTYVEMARNRIETVVARCQERKDAG